MDVFRREFGVHQGRIAKPDAAEGSFVYELGHALLRDAVVLDGDSHTVGQDFVVSPGSTFIRASVVIRAPVVPVSGNWVVHALINQVIVVSRRLRASKRPVVLSDWAISLADADPAPTLNTLGFMLEYNG